MRSIGIVFKQKEMCLVSLKEGLNKVYFDGYNIIPFMNLKKEDKEDAILNNLERFLKSHKGARDNIFIALPRDTALIRFINLPIAVEENLRKSIEYELDRHTPFSSDEAYFDYHVVRRIPESGLIYIMLVTIKKDSVDYYIELLKKINIKPRNIEITTTALFNAFQDSVSPEKELINLNWLKKNKTLKEKYLKGLIKKSPKIAGFFKEQPEDKRQPSLDILIEYLDDDKYELNLTDKNSLYYSKVFNTAEKIPDKHFKEIYDNGLKSVLHLPFDKDSKKKTEFILSGRKMEKDYTEHAPEEIKGFFSIMNRFRITPASDSAGANTVVLPLLSVPIGLALKGLKSVALDINLVPLSRRLKKKRSKRKLVIAAIPFIILLLIAALISNSINKAELREAALDKELKQYKLKAKNIDRIQNEIRKIEQSSTTIKNIKESSISKLTFLKELTLLMPMDGWLSDFSYKVSNKKIKLSGYAVSASKLIPILEESKLLENVKFTSPITTDRKSEKEKFRIEMTVSSEKK